MELKDLPITEELITLLEREYGIGHGTALQFVADLNCETIQVDVSPIGRKLVSLFCASSDEIRIKSIEDTF